MKLIFLQMEDELEITTITATSQPTLNQASVDFKQPKKLYVVSFKLIYNHCTSKLEDI